VRIRLAVPEAVHQLQHVPGLQVLSAEGKTVDAVADPGALAHLRDMPLVRDLRVRVAQVAPQEPVEPLLATVGHGLVELLRQPEVQVLLLLLGLRLAFRKAP
jgi:hypothetical protein